MSMQDYLTVRDPKMDDIIESLRELYCMYNGEVYGLPYDGDVHLYYYRKDLIENAEEQANFKTKYGYDLAVPQTWDQAHDFAEFFTRKKGEKLAGETLAGDFFGNGMLLARGWSRYEFMDHFIAYGGQYFDENLNPLINSEAGVKALDELIAMSKFAPEGVLSWGYSENRGAFLSNQLASMILWSDLFKFSYNAEESSVAGKVGLSHIPGSMQDGELYYKATMPFGRIMCLTATTKHPAEAFYVASYMSEFASKYFTSDPTTGEDPFRYSQVDDPQFLADSLSNFSKSEVPVADCANYYEAIKNSFENGYPDLSIPGANQYMDILDLNVNKALTGAVAPKDALDEIVKEWNNISESLGVDNQKAIWQAQVSTWKQLGLIK
jgi:multiple sugar transport system substrate-binding protein